MYVCMYVCMYVLEVQQYIDCLIVIHKPMIPYRYTFRSY